MDMNNKGQAMMFGFMMAVFIIIMALVLINPLKEIIVDARDTDQLNCTSTTLTWGEESACLGLDLLLPYFITFVIAVGFGYILYKKKSFSD
jgi:hypothetical protein